jgi:hypothetical protein
VVCTSPCDTVLPTDIEYRATGRAVENSRWFSIPDDAATDVIEVRPASETVKWVGALLIGAGAIAELAIFTRALESVGDTAASCSSPTQPQCSGTGTPNGWYLALGGGLASMFAGVVVVLLNGSTKVVQTRGPLRPLDGTPPSPAASFLEMTRRERGLALVPALPTPGVVLYATSF